MDVIWRSFKEANARKTLIACIPSFRLIKEMAKTWTCHVAESNNDLKRAAFKQVSTAAKSSWISLEVINEDTSRIDNYNRKEHSQAIIEFNGVPKLMNLLRSSDRGPLHLHELVLLCNLAINAGNSKALEQARVLSVLEGAARYVVAHHPDLREVFAKAIHQLTIYQAGIQTHREV
ncbi:hypothetical protein Salat_1478400 [Sesamum alatum]|uniref:Uncharacterized protein n=1 Tax=Sesamum alatum TaxID=300844 RepID=A0AAE1YBK3_9LAMI|nr:hypothetical protein Salat_1478400 [Sesamum alatum]